MYKISFDDNKLCCYVLTYCSFALAQAQVKQMMSISHFAQVFIGIGEILLSLNWAILADILLVSGTHGVKIINSSLTLCSKALNLATAQTSLSCSVCVPCGFQYVVVPTRRATAEALQIMVLHLLGDAGSPYLIGAVQAVTHFIVEYWLHVYSVICIPPSSETQIIPTDYTVVVYFSSNTISILMYVNDHLPYPNLL